MNLFKYIVCSIAAFAAISTHAGEQYSEANIERIELCELSNGAIVLFLSDVTGVVPSVGNGCSNSGNFPYVQIATNSEEFASKQGMLSMALTSYAAGKRIRVRYDDTNNKILSIALL